MQLIEAALLPSNKWLHLKQPVVLPDNNTNFKQTTLQKLLQVSTFYADALFELISTTVNRIIHHTLLEFSRI